MGGRTLGEVLEKRDKEKHLVCLLIQVWQPRGHVPWPVQEEPVCTVRRKVRPSVLSLLVLSRDWSWVGREQPAAEAPSWELEPWGVYLL